MKNTFLHSPLPKFVWILLLAASMNACKKNTITQIDQPVDQSIVAKAIKWLNSQQAEASKQEEKEKYELLKNNLGLDKLWVEDIRENEKIILVPIKETFVIKNNNDKPVSNYLFLIIDEKHEIRKGEILQYLSEDKSKKANLPVNELNRYYLFEPVNGQFTHLAILDTDHFLYETEFRNNKRYRSSYVVPKTKSPNDGPQASLPEHCVTFNWYLVTQITYDDGTTETNQQFLFTTIECDGGGTGGGGGSTPPAEEARDSFPRTTDVVWIVGEGVSGRVYWRINSSEKLNGFKYKNPNKLSIYSSVQHNNTELVAPQNFATWHQGTKSVNMQDEYFTKATNSGIIYFSKEGEGFKTVSREVGWRSYDLWP